MFFFKKSESHDCFYSDFCIQNISLHILSTGTAVLYLCVPLRTKGICETSRSDAIHITVHIE